MNEKMLKFTLLGQTTPKKRENAKRKKYFKEIYNGYVSERAKEQ